MKTRTTPMRQPLILEPRLGLIVSAMHLNAYTDGVELSFEDIGHKIGRGSQFTKDRHHRVMRMLSSYWKYEFPMGGPPKFDSKTADHAVRASRDAWNDFWAPPTTADSLEIAELKAQVTSLKGKLEVAQSRLRAVKAAATGKLKE